MNPKTGRPRRTFAISPPGEIPKGWCLLQPYYLALPDDVNPKIKAKADEVLGRLRDRDEWETHTIDGVEYVFILDAIYHPDGPDGDYTAPGIRVLRREKGAQPWPWKTAKEVGNFGRPRDGADLVDRIPTLTREQIAEEMQKHGGGIRFKERRSLFGKYAVRPWHSTLGGLAIALAVTYGAGVFFLKARQRSS